MPVNSDVKKYGSNMKVNLAAMSGWFGDLSHVEMVEQVAAYGFSAFECLSANKWEDKEAVRDKCQELGVKVGAISCSGTIKGDGPVNPAFHPTFVAETKEAIKNAKLLGTNVVLALTGALRDDLSFEQQMANAAAAGKLVAPYLEDAGITLVWELLNIKVNHAGYSLVYSKDGADLVRATASPNVKMLFDIYHQQISEGDVIRNIQTYSAEIGHYHFGDNPGRHEPGTGELNYKNIFKAIAATGYTGIVSSEFSKTPEITVDSLMALLAECATW